MVSESVEKGQRVFLLGNRAIARGAIEGGIKVASGYPGTPSSEILAELARAARDYGYYVEWSTNEKVAFEVAAGAALVGARAIVTMKNAGLNVALDTFMTLPYGGVRGGLVIVVADDPGAHYSSTEQDTRRLGAYARILCLEPSTPQEGKDMTRIAFEISEETELPVLLRSTTRVSHSSADVLLGEIPKRESALGFNKHWKMAYRWNVYGPPGPVNKHQCLEERQAQLQQIAEDSIYNSLDIVGAGTGIVAVGIGYAYVLDALEELKLDSKINVLKIGTPYPLPVMKLERILETSEQLIVIEEGEPFVEESIRELAQRLGYGRRIIGKGSGFRIPPYGELTPDLVGNQIASVMGRSASRGSRRKQWEETWKSRISSRSSTLCPGCPHLGTYWSLKEALKQVGGKIPIVNGDIGCYEQGGYGVFSQQIIPTSHAAREYQISSPYEILDTNYVMGSGISLSQGERKAGYADGPIVAVAGDSTFFHAAMPAIVNAVVNGADIVFLVLDNRWTAMTGHQPSPVTGMTAGGKQTKTLRISDVCKSFGVEFLRMVDPYDTDESAKAIEEAIRYKGVAVVILQRECALQRLRSRGKEELKITQVDEGTCLGCKTCLQLGCPAIKFSEGKASIDELLCVSCGLCQQICSVNAIEER